MMSRDLHDGASDGLTPLDSLDLGTTESFSDLVRAMGKTSFAGRKLGEAFEILADAARNDSCRMVLTVSGAMTVAKQGLILCDLIDRGIARCVVATGALIAHGLTESIGLLHFRCDPNRSDATLYREGYNRIYDTVEMEANLNDVESLIKSVLDAEVPPDGTWSSARLCRAIGRHLSERGEGRGILRSAYEQNVPVFIPAMTDSEIGLDMALWAIDKAHPETKGRSSLTLEEIFSSVPPFNPFLDLVQYARFIGESDELGILTIGGGVPRNWSQQVSPFFDLVCNRLGMSLRVPRFRYGVRICPEPVHWGGLSGSTYSEGVSWGKFLPPEEGGRFAEVFADATVVLPLLAKALFEELDR